MRRELNQTMYIKKNKAKAKQKDLYISLRTSFWVNIIVS